MVSVGIDLHRRRSDLVGVDDVGSVVWKRRILQESRVSRCDKSRI
jgi:hypothetical protein